MMLALCRTKSAPGCSAAFCAPPAGEVERGASARALCAQAGAASAAAVEYIGRGGMRLDSRS